MKLVRGSKLIGLNLSFIIDSSILSENQDDYVQSMENL